MASLRSDIDESRARRGETGVKAALAPSKAPTPNGFGKLGKNRETKIMWGKLDNTPIEQGGTASTVSGPLGEWEIKERA